MKRESGINSEPRGPIKKALPVKREPGIKPEPGATAKKAPAVKPERGIKSTPKLGLINGCYHGSACPYPRPAPEFPDESFNLTLAFDTPGTSIWGDYILGDFSGIIHIAQRPIFPSEEPIPLEWRGCGNVEGESIKSFGDDCFGEIAFLGNGRIRGSLTNLYAERCDFQGVKFEHVVSRRPARSMRAEWDWYDEDSYEAYEAERTGRWYY